MPPAPPWGEVLPAIAGRLRLLQRGPGEPQRTRRGEEGHYVDAIAL